ncbi:hypothetical protein Taro_010971 [Colocasia esculenta]|uniref:Uncharacterized protein n=1 Tax=Colocasia esculenta TaxID=4460 RepID=A0A843U8J9_COLES|nr:hypothetical protein [Colocasia esculenta]
MPLRDLFFPCLLLVLACVRWDYYSPSGSLDPWAATAKIGSSAWAEGRVLGSLQLIWGVRIPLEPGRAELGRARRCGMAAGAGWLLRREEKLPVRRSMVMELGRVQMAREESWSSGMQKLGQAELA